MKFFKKFKLHLQNTFSLEIEFKDPKLLQLFEGVKVTDKNYRYPEELLNQFRKTIRKLQSGSNIGELKSFKSLNYEKLKGNLKGKCSARINKQYRLILEEIINPLNKDSVEILAIEEISKHYE